MSKHTETNVIDVVARFREAQETLRAVTAEGLLPVFAEAFRRNPLIKCMIWTQYTPYFNDGDPCEFSAHVDRGGARSHFPPRGTLSGWDVVAGKMPDLPRGDEIDGFTTPEDYDDPVLGYGYSSKGDGNEAALEQAGAVSQAVADLPEDLLESVFGDGVKVLVWEGGILTTGYSHD